MLKVWALSALLALAALAAGSAAKHQLPDAALRPDGHGRRRGDGGSGVAAQAPVPGDGREPAPAAIRADGSSIAFGGAAHPLVRKEQLASRGTDVRSDELLAQRETEDSAAESAKAAENPEAENPEAGEGKEEEVVDLPNDHYAGMSDYAKAVHKTLPKLDLKPEDFDGVRLQDREVTIGGAICEDTAETGVSDHSGGKVACPDLLGYCSDKTYKEQVRVLCPKTCGLCAIEVDAAAGGCRDGNNTDTPVMALTAQDGKKVPMSCTELRRFCEYDTDVAQKCPRTCGRCTGPGEKDSITKIEVTAGSFLKIIKCFHDWRPLGTAAWDGDLGLPFVKLHLSNVSLTLTDKGNVTAVSDSRPLSTFFDYLGLREEWTSMVRNNVKQGPGQTVEDAWDESVMQILQECSMAGVRIETATTSTTTSPTPWEVPTKMPLKSAWQDMGYLVKDFGHGRRGSSSKGAGKEEKEEGKEDAETQETGESSGDGEAPEA